MNMQELGRRIGFDFRYTRYPRDLEPSLSPSLGIPGYLPAPLREDPRFPETCNSIEKTGYVEPVASGLTSEFQSFYQKLEAEPEQIWENLINTVDNRFDEWDEARSSEVVYRTDGFEKFLNKLQLFDQNQQGLDMKRFFQSMASENERIEKIIENMDIIPMVKLFLETGQMQTNLMKRKNNHPITDILQNPSTQDPSLRFSALRAAWWLRLVYYKQFQQSPAFLRMSNTPGGAAAGATLPQMKYVATPIVRKDWTSALTEFFVKTLCEITEPKERAPRKVFGINRRQQAPEPPGMHKVPNITEQQLTGRSIFHANKFELFEYISSMIRFHFEGEIIDRFKFFGKLVEAMRHMHVGLPPPGKRGPLPLSICYLLVANVSSYAPYMDEVFLKYFWRLCSLNLRALYWNTSTARQELHQDPAFQPFSKILQQSLEFVESVTSKEVMERWEREFLENTGGSSQTSSSSTSASIFPSSSSVLTEANSTFPVFKDDRQNKVRHNRSLVCSVRSSMAEDQGGRVTIRFKRKREDPEQVQVNNRPNTPVPGSSSNNTNPGTASSSSTTVAGPPPTAPKPHQPWGGKRQGSKIPQDPIDPWRKFELISNTESLHYLLRNAKKVKRLTTRKTSILQKPL